MDQCEADCVLPSFVSALLPERARKSDPAKTVCATEWTDRDVCGFFFCLLLQQPKPLNHVKGHICQICGDDVGLTAEGELFVACNECAFPVCRPCYDYERNDGNQSCPQCKTRYKRHKGRV